MRFTCQRLKILDNVQKRKDHPSAEMVYAEIRKELPAISLATVHRNLAFLAKAGQIKKFEVNGENHYDGDMCKHEHCVCDNCHQIIDVMQPEIYDHALKHFADSRFEPNSVCIMYHGICSDCK